MVVFYFSVLQFCLPLIFDNHSAGTRTKISFSRSTMRAVAQGIAEKYSKDKVLIPGEPYWGPLTKDFVNKLEIDFRDGELRSANDVIDPYNRDSVVSRKGPITFVDRAGYVRIRGGDFMYWTDGKVVALIVGRGPDQVLNTTESLLTGVSFGSSYDLPSPLQQINYDPTNGTISSGDLFALINLNDQ